MAQNTLWKPSDIQNAETGETEAPKRRGRIPQSAWPGILERHRAGATLSAIAREFDCTPSAISYIIRKAEAAGMQPDQPVNETGEAPPAEAAAPMPEAASESEGASEPSVAPEPQTTPEPQATPEPETPSARAPAATRPRPASPSGRSRLVLAEQRPSDNEKPAAPQPDMRSPEPLPNPGRAPEDRAEDAQARPTSGQPAGRSEPVDAIEARLRDTARGCLLAYRAWRQQPGEGSIQGLSDAMHELRKALARIEIEMSGSRREDQALRPIPIPAHRAARRSR